MKKILFNDRYRLTDAVLEGRKTMTRRIIKTPRTMEGKDVYGFSVVRYPRTGVPIEMMALDADGAQINNILPKYKVGEVVAVAQAYRDAINPLDWVNTLIHKNEPGWTNKMFVGADLMPHQIFINAVRVERLQDISDEDCLREGVQAAKTPYGIRYVAGGERVPDFEVPLSVNYSFKTPREAFAALIDRVSGKGTWADNPPVFVYSFELIKTPEPAFPPAPAQSAQKSFVAGVGFEPTTSGL